MPGMTLILNVLTRDYVVQVSDRRLVSPGGSIFEDDRNKSILYKHHAVFGYTGTAALTPTPTGHGGTHRLEALPGFPHHAYTDEWLLAVLADASGKDFGHVIDSVGMEASKAVARSNLVDPRLRIMSVGFVPFTDRPDDLTAASWSISNYDDSGALRKSDGSEFVLAARRIEADESFVLVPSSDLPPEIATRAQRTLRKAVERGGPRAVARELCATVRAVADKRKGVGRNLLVVTVPAEAIRNLAAGHEFLVDASEALPDRATFLYSPEAGPTTAQKTMSWVGPGGLRVSNVTMMRAASLVHIRPGP